MRNGRHQCQEDEQHGDQLGSLGSGTPPQGDGDEKTRGTDPDDSAGKFRGRDSPSLPALPDDDARQPQYDDADSDLETSAKP